MTINLLNRGQELDEPICSGVLLPDGDRRLTTEQAALILGVQPNSLALWRCVKRHSLPYYRVGRRVYYRLSDVLAFMETCRREGK